LEAGGLELETGCIYHTTTSPDNQSDHHHEPGGGPPNPGHYPGCTSQDQWHAGGADIYGHRFGLGRGRKLANSGIIAAGSSEARLSGAGAGRSVPPPGNGQSADGTELGLTNGERARAEPVADRLEVQPRWQRLLVKTISCMVTSLLTIWAGRSTQFYARFFKISTFIA